MRFPQALRSKKPWKMFRFELYLQQKEGMVDYWVLLGVVVFTLYQIYKYYHDKPEDSYDESLGIADGVVVPESGTGKDDYSNGEKDSVAGMEEIIGTRDLVFQTLRRIGCEYREEEDNRILFKYQGEPFMIVATNDSYFIEVYDNWWYSLSINCEVEEFARLQKVINYINAFVTCTVLYIIHKELEQISVHTKRNILFIPQIPEIELYLVSVLDDFFKTQRLLITELEKYKVREEQL